MWDSKRIMAAILTFAVITIVSFVCYKGIKGK